MERGFILSLIFAAIVAIFALNNSGMVLIDFFFAEFELSQAIVIFVSALFGAIIAAIFSGVRSLKSNRKIKKLNQEILDLKEQNMQLTNIVESKDKQIKTISKEVVDTPRRTSLSDDSNDQIIKTE